MNELLQKLINRGTTITDGAWGTQLQARGLSQGRSPDAWNLSHPALVEEVPTAYFTAGSQIVLTNTFQANRLSLASHDLADKAREINLAGAEISLRAIGQDGLVFGSIGPSGKMLLAGQTTEDELAEVFAEQAQALARGGVHGIVIETMADLVEAKIALVAAQNTGLPVVACMVFDSGKQLDRTMMGATAEQVAKELTSAGADVIGANCGQGVESYVEVCRQLRAATDLPLWIKPNAGIPEVNGDQVVYQTTPDEFAASAAALVEAGANFIGGCCGTSPEFIRALRAVT